MITQERLKELLDYNPKTGVFTNKITRSSKAKKGAVAGGIRTEKNGDRYVAIKLDNNQYLAHRLAWLYVYGFMPDCLIDHIDNNGCKTDNRIENLRLATHKQNQENRGIPKNNTSGIKGVSWDSRSGRWKAAIKHNGKSICLGYYANIDDAASARQNAENLLFTHSPQREFIGLTDEEIGVYTDKQADFARAIEAKLREKNA